MDRTLCLFLVGWQNMAKHVCSKTDKDGFKILDPHTLLSRVMCSTQPNVGDFVKAQSYLLRRWQWKLTFGGLHSLHRLCRSSQLIVETNSAKPVDGLASSKLVEVNLCRHLSSTGWYLLWYLLRVPFGRFLEKNGFVYQYPCSTGKLGRHRQSCSVWT